jgi:hypothetical protein
VEEAPIDSTGEPDIGDSNSYQQPSDEEGYSEPSTGLDEGSEGITPNTGYDDYQGPSDNTGESSTYPEGSDSSGSDSDSGTDSGSYDPGLIGPVTRPTTGVNTGLDNSDNTVGYNPPAYIADPGNLTVGPSDSSNDSDDSSSSDDVVK